MKFYLFLSFIFISVSTFAQDDKPRYFYDENELQITDSLFIKKLNLNKNKFKYLNLNFQNDTCYVSLLVRRKNYGKLKQVEFDSLQKSLTNGIISPKEKYTIIQYHPGADKCNSGKAFVMPDKKNVLEKRFFKKINKDSGIKNYWIHKKDEKVEYHKVKSVHWQLDINEIVESLFFKLHYPCHSFVIIDNFTKNYISFFGEYHSGQIVDYFKELSSKN